MKYGIVMHEFFEACGLDGRLQLDLEGPGGPVCRSLDRPFAVIGRNAGADLTLSDRRVSRRHAYLQAIAGEVFCVDLGSRSGVLWGRHCGRSGWVDREPGVVINPFRIRQGKAEGAAGASEGSDRPEDPLAKQFPGLTLSGGVVLEFSHEEVEQSSWKMNRMLT
ncbi:MAG: FHA domain-containing protein, partial [Pseudomonadota bacterium]|nr:FHA domain-containing protein [Pseudomonadota bacterium]